jgi:hypothetical protein
MLHSRGDRFSRFVYHALLAASILSRGQVHALERRTEWQNTTVLPAPISISPAQDWIGIDGQWSVLALSVGEPAQWIRTLVSTASQQTWVVYSSACNRNITDDNNVTTLVKDDQCVKSRGGIVNVSESKTWNERGFYQLWTERNMGLEGNGKYGYDSVGIGYPGERGPTIKNVTIGALITPNFWLGHFGLHPKPTNFSAFEEPSPSYMTYLFKNKLIPSISFGYTAGARYRFTAVLSSLTLGGYDTSRYIPNDLTFRFAPDNERDLVVPLVGVYANSSTKSNISLLKEPTSVFIDSTLAELWLPRQLCEAFEDAFGLKYDEDTDLYLVDDIQHQQLLADNPTVTFTLGQKYVTNSTIDIVLPYSAFDLRAKPPYRGLQNESYFFPIRRAANESQHVFGRTFLQEAYLVVDWERQNFSIYQNSWVFGADKNIVPIISPNFTGEMEPHKSNALSTAAIIGIAIGGGFSFALICFGIFWLIRRKRRTAKMMEEYKQKAAASKETSTDKASEPLSPTDPEEGTNVFPKAELPADHGHRPDVKEGDASASSQEAVVEADNTERQVFEMMGDIPTRQEADGRQLSEKESMMVRERIYNGVDPIGSPPISPNSEEPPRRPAPISPSEVTMVRRPPQNVSPITPRTPRDGASLEANDTFFQPPSSRAPLDGRYLEAEETIMSPISPLEGSDASRRRFSYEVL